MINKTARWKKGFTLAEMLVTIAILGILAGFGFVEVIHTQQRLKLKEMDEAAKEIFIAAQNHMTSSWAADTWPTSESSSLGRKMSEAPRVINLNDNPSGTPRYAYLLSHKQGDDCNVDSNGILYQYILPFGSIDETVRSGGNYVIEYDYETASVYDVFYIDGEDGSFSFTDTVLNDVFNMATSSSDTTNQRLSYTVGGKKRLIGYYGPGKSVLAHSDGPLELPNIYPENKENLWVVINDLNSTDSSLQLVYYGEQSGAELTVDVDLSKNEGIKVTKTISNSPRVTKGTEGNTFIKKVVNSEKGTSTYYVLMDSATQDNKQFCRHFLYSNTGFIPGENIHVKAILTNSNGDTVENTSVSFNSLFGGLLSGKKGAYTVQISTVRHLQNLSFRMSGLGVKLGTNNERITLGTINLVKDLDMRDAFYKNSEHSSPEALRTPISLNGLWDDTNRFYYGNNGEVLKEKYFSKFAGISTYPITVGSLTFNGNGYVLTNFDFFGVNTIVKNKDLMITNNFNPQSYGVTVESEDWKFIGLFGLVSHPLTINRLFIVDSRCSYVNTDSYGSAGMFVGRVKDAEITLKECGTYLSSKELYKAGAFNFKTKTSGVPGKTNNALNKGVYSGLGGYAGGLIGSSIESKVDIDQCFSAVPVIAGQYSNASNNEAIAGGLIGELYRKNTDNKTVSKIKNSYVGGYTEQTKSEDGKVYRDYSIESIGIASFSKKESFFKSAGGLIGLVNNEDVELENCFSAASVISTRASGGICGYTANYSYFRSVKNVYSIGRVFAALDWEKQNSTNQNFIIKSGMLVGDCGQDTVASYIEPNSRNYIFDYSRCADNYDHYNYPNLAVITDAFFAQNTVTVDDNENMPRYVSEEMKNSKLNPGSIVGFTRPYINNDISNGIYPYVGVNNTRYTNPRNDSAFTNYQTGNSRNIGGKYSYYGDWPEPKVLPVPVAECEDGNKLALHFAVDKDEPYVTIKVTGIISGNSRYLNLYRDSTGVLHGVGTTLAYGNITSSTHWQWAQLHNTLYTHGYCVKNTDGSYNYTVWLDDPTSAYGNFAYLFCTGSNNLFAGEDIEIKVCNGLDEPDDDNTTISVITNGMFAYKADKPNPEHVYIESSRHLLNLDTFYSGVNVSDYTDLRKMVVKYAHQTCDIQWLSNDYSGMLAHRKYQPYLDEVKELAAIIGTTGEIRRTFAWGPLEQDSEKTNRFQSIRNEELISYDGGGYTLDSFVLYNGVTGGASGFFSDSNNNVMKSITNLTVNNVTVLSDQSTAVLMAGLENNTGFTVSNVHITGDHSVIGGGHNYSGALFAFVNNSNVTLNNVRVEGEAINISAGIDAGGLIGQINSGTINIDGAKVIGKTLSISNSSNYVGGLIGSASLSGNSSIKNITITGTSLSIKSRAHVGGVVGTVSGSDLTFDGINIYGDNLTITSDTNGHAGGLAGYTGNAVTIKNSVVVGKNMKVSGAFAAGGLVGNSNNKLTISDSVTSMYIKSYGTWSGAGGLVGYHTSNALSIKNSYVAGHTSSGYYADTLNEKISGHYNIIADAEGAGDAAGGLVGRISGGTLSVTNSYSTASVYSDEYAGGLIGVDLNSNLDTVYTTGLVKGSAGKAGIISGSASNPTSTKLFYLNTINPSETRIIGNYPSYENYAIGANPDSEGVENNPFVVTSSQSANPFDSSLARNYPYKKAITKSYNGGTYVHIGDWPTPKKTTVTFDPNGTGATVIDSKKTAEIFIGDIIGNRLPSSENDEVKWEPYEFYGWYTESIGGERIDENTVVTSENATYYAHWIEVNEFTQNDTFVPNKNGVYLFEAWGSKKSDEDTVSYTSGEMYITASDSFSVNVGNNGESSDIRTTGDSTFTLKNRIMTAAGSNDNSGYFSEEIGIIKNSYVSGHSLSNAVTADSTENDVLFTGQPIDSSGWFFAEPQIKNGVEGSFTGKVRISRMIMGPDDSGDSDRYSHGDYGGLCFTVDSEAPVIAKEEDATVHVYDQYSKEEIADQAKITASVNTKVSVKQGKISPVPYAEETEFLNTLKSPAYGENIVISNSDHYDLENDIYTFVSTGEIAGNNITYRNTPVEFTIIVKDAEITYSYQSYYNDTLIDDSDGTDTIIQTTGAKDLSVTAYNLVSVTGTPTPTLDGWASCKFNKAMISVNGSDYVEFKSLDVRSYVDTNDQRHDFTKDAVINVKFYFVDMSGNQTYSATPAEVRGNVGNTGKFTVLATDDGIDYEVTSASHLTVNDETVATVERDGTVNYLARGVTYVTGSVGGQTFRCKVFVKETADEDYPSDYASALQFENETLEKNIGDSPFTLSVNKINKSGDIEPLTDDERAALQWLSGNTEVATVDENGIVTVIAVGETIITATLNESNGSLSGEMTLKVSPNPLEIVLVRTLGEGQYEEYNSDNLYVNKNDLSIKLSYSGEEGYVPDHEVRDLTLSCDEEFATLNYRTILPYKETTFEISASYTPKSGRYIGQTLTATKTVSIKLGTIVFNTEGMEPIQHKAFAFNTDPVIKYGDDDYPETTVDRTKLTYNSTDDSIATINSNGITFVGEGTTTISFVYNDYSISGKQLDLASGSIDVSVRKDELQSIEFTEDSYVMHKDDNELSLRSLVIGKYVSSYEGSLSQQEFDSIDWSSTDEDIARVENGTVIRGNKTGTATITAKINSHEDSCTLLVDNLHYPLLVISKENRDFDDSKKGYVLSYTAYKDDTDEEGYPGGLSAQQISLVYEASDGITVISPDWNATGSDHGKTTVKFDRNCTVEKIVIKGTLAYSYGYSDYEGAEGEIELTNPWSLSNNNSPLNSNISTFSMNKPASIDISSLNEINSLTNNSITQNIAPNNGCIEETFDNNNLDGNTVPSEGNNSDDLSDLSPGFNDIDEVSKDKTEKPVTDETQNDEKESSEEKEPVIPAVINILKPSAFRSFLATNPKPATNTNSDNNTLVPEEEPATQEPVLPTSSPVMAALMEDAAVFKAEALEPEQIFVTADTYDVEFYIDQKDAVLPNLWKRVGDNKFRVNPYYYEWHSDDEDVVVCDWGAIEVKDTGETDLHTTIYGCDVTIHVTVSENPEITGFKEKGSDYSVSTTNGGTFSAETKKWPTKEPKENTADSVKVYGTRIVEESGAYYLIADDFEADWDELVGNIGSYLSDADEDGNHYVVKLPVGELLDEDDFFEEDGAPKVELLPGDAYRTDDTVYVVINSNKEIVKPEVSTDGWFNLKDMKEYVPGADTGPETDLAYYPGSEFNPYPGTIKSNCTYAVWALVNQTLGIKLPGWGNAGSWLRRAQISGYPTGNKPAKYSIIVFDTHVGFVTDVNEVGTMMFIKEGNYAGKYHEQWWSVGPTRGSLKVLGYIYLTNDRGDAIEAETIVLDEVYHDPEEEFLNLLAELGLEPGERTEAYDDEVEEGHILSYRTGEYLMGSVVDYVVSKGPEPVKTISVDETYKNKPEAELLDWFDKNGKLKGSRIVIDADGNSVEDEENHDPNHYVVVSIHTGEYEEGSVVSYTVRKNVTNITPEETENSGITDPEVTPGAEDPNVGNPEPEVTPAADSQQTEPAVTQTITQGESNQEQQTAQEIIGTPETQNLTGDVSDAGGEVTETATAPAPDTTPESAPEPTPSADPAPEAAGGEQPN